MSKIIIISFGAVLGVLYYNYFGCSQSCAITSSPINSTIYGAIFGLVISLENKKKDK
jgi:hypothetical protein